MVILMTNGSVLPMRIVSVCVNRPFCYNQFNAIIFLIPFDMLSFKHARYGIFFIALLASMSLASYAFAANSTLSLTSTGDGDTIQISATGDPNASVILSYIKTNVGLSLSIVGKTDAKGILVTTVSSAAYQVTPTTPVHVSINNRVSPDVEWPTTAIAGTGLSLPNTSLVLPLKQSKTFTTFNNGTNPIYLSSNSSPQVANVNINGNQITILGNNLGSTTVTLCAQGTTVSCASTYITVQNTNATPLAFSQSNVSVANGSSTQINILGGTGTFVFVSNSNTAAVQSSMSGSVVTLKALQSSGFSAVTVCSSDMSACGIINVNIGTTSSTPLTFNQSNPTITVGQNISLSIMGAPSNSSLSLFSNSNAVVAQTILSGTTLNITGLTAGTSNIAVCTTLGVCAATTVTVNASVTTTGGKITLSQNNVFLSVGQTLSIAITGGEMPYSTISTSANITATVNGSLLSVTGITSGSGTTSVCSGEGGCITLSVLVNGTGTAVSNNTLSLSQSSVSVIKGSTTSVNITGNGSYTVSNNSNPSAATATISGTSVLVSGITVGNATVSVCQNQTQCVVLSIAVTAAPTVATTPITTTTSDWATCAGEKQTCTFLGAKIIRYGANGIYLYKTLTGSAYCANSTFGDPLPNVEKSCSYGGSIPVGYVAPTPEGTADASGWTTCASEKRSCPFTGSKSVRYGANSKYFYKTIENGVICSNDTFGDPIPGVVKTCSYGGVIPTTISTPAPVVSTPSPIATTKLTLKNPISYGMKGNDVVQLKKILTQLGFFTGVTSSTYDTATIAAVKKYQKSKGITQTGNVGPLTLAALNK